jgi:hypothetical protein
VSYPPGPVASERRCTVTGRKDGGELCSVVVEETSSKSAVVLYPHGLGGLGVVLDRDEQQVLGAWLLSRRRTSRRAG